jgi:hypothetical protein
VCDFFRHQSASKRWDLELNSLTITNSLYNSSFYDDHHHHHQHYIHIVKPAKIRFYAAFTQCVHK